MKMIDIFDRIQGSSRYVEQADYVLAFAGKEMYVLKSRSVSHRLSMEIPEPETIVAYIRFPKPHVKQLFLREAK